MSIGLPSRYRFTVLAVIRYPVLRMISSSLSPLSLMRAARRGTSGSCFICCALLSSKGRATVCANGWACVDTGLGSTADEEGLGTGPRHLRLVIEVELVDAISAQRARRLTLPEP